MSSMIVALDTPDTPMWGELATVLDGAAGISEVRIRPPVGERAGVEAIVAFRMDAGGAAEWPDLRAIAAPMAGLNAFDLEALGRRGIDITPAHANGPYVAERALALTLGFAGQLVPWHSDLGKGVWHGFAVQDPVDESWWSLRGEQVSILGTGAIGIALARLLQPLDVTCVGMRRSGRTDDLPRGLFARIESDPVAAVTGSKVVIVTLPLTTATAGLIDRRALDAMAGALLVNVGRGAVIDEAALYDALASRRLLGAALDTWWRYPKAGEGRPERPTMPSAQPFHQLDNVLLSPHLGGFTAKATAASAREAVDAIAAYAATGSLPGAITHADGY